MKPIAITLGDPAGIGAEVVFKALADLSSSVPFVLFGDRGYAAQSPHFDSSVAPFVDVDLSKSRPLRFGEVAAEYGEVSLASIDAALEAIADGKCSALVTAPIHKQALAAAGSSWLGHTDLLADRAGLTRYGYEYAMYFDSPELKVVLRTVHMPLREALERLDADSIAALIALTRHEFKRLYGIDPRIAVAGINPHGGEGGMFGSEENVIADAVKSAERSGARVSGPWPADTVFMLARRGQFDVVVAMYHDQGLIPVKTVAFEQSVNVTLGLPYLRSSVDHGTAFDIAGKGVADHGPMKYAIEWTARHAEGFRR